MTARDELAEIIANFRDDWYKVERMPPAGIDRDEATAILAAGYRKPRQVATLAELRALPTGSVIMTSQSGRVGKIKSTADGGKMICWALIGDNIAGMNQLVAKNSLPATVLHEGAQP